MAARSTSSSATPILIFFGDPETKGDAEDARACLRMALDMQRRIAELNAKWRSEGIEQPFRVRMGINTGYLQCRQFRQRRPHGLYDHRRRGQSRGAAAVDRRAGQIVISYETYALVRDMLVAHALPPIQMKGISRAVVPYVVDGVLEPPGDKVEIFSEHMTGLDFYLDPSMVERGAPSNPQAVAERAEGIGEKWRPSSRGTGRGAAMIQTMCVGSYCGWMSSSRASARHAPACRGSIGRWLRACPRRSSRGRT